MRLCSDVDMSDRHHPEVLTEEESMVRERKSSEGLGIEIPVHGTVRELGSGKDNSQKMGQIHVSEQVSKTAVEDLIKRLTIDEMNSKWVDDIFARVKSELAENRHLSSQHTPLSSGASSPTSQPSKLSSTPRASAYQATVEDVPEEEPLKPQSKIETLSHSQRSSVDMTSNSPTPSLVSDSTSSDCRSSLPKPSLVTGSKSPGSPPRTSHSVRFRDRGPVILHSPSRTSPVEIDNGISRYSTVDQKWGRLFDSKSNPTERLGQLLRGIANYMIAEYFPYNSLVLTPEKLQSFYAKYKVASDILPYQQIFDCRPRGSLDNLEYLYQQLRCEHHLVQGSSSSMPHIPSLTPSGFESWMICQIAAFPEQEAQRLGRIVADLPITADAGDKSERLPRQLSAHLFPAERNAAAYDLVLDVMTVWIKNAELDDMIYRKNYRDDSYKSRSSREDSGRRRSDDSRHGSSTSKHRRRSGDSHRSSSRAEEPRDVSPTTTKHHSHSPSSSHRSTSTVIDSQTGEYGLVSSDPRSTRRRNREKDYRMYQGRSSTDKTPRTVNRDDRRGSQAEEVYYEESARTPRSRAHDERFSNGQERYV